MELSSCLDCHDLADALRKHVKMVREAQKYITDAHAGEVRNITPLEALQEQAEYYEDMMDDQDDAINDLETEVEKLEGEINKLAKYILSISPDGIPEGSACEVAIKLIEYLRNGDGKNKKFHIPVYGL